MRTTMNRPQMRVVLDFLGVPFSRQGANMKQSQALLDTFIQNQPEEYNKAVAIIVRHELPEAATERETSFHDLGKIVHEHIANMQTSAIDKVRRESMEIAKAAIEREAKKFRKVEIIVNGKSSKKLDFVAPAVFDDIMQLAAARLNVLMTGPAGCGKTFLAEKVAESLGLDFASQSCSEGMSESALTGWLLPTGTGGKFTYVQSDFVRIYENGGVFLFDEMDAADPNVMVFMNQALANEGFHLPQRYNKPFIKKHPDFVAIAATNTFGNGADQMYVGRNQLDAATLDRFKVGTVAMGYDAGVEESIVEASVLVWGRNVRASIERHNLRRIMSTRVMKDASRMVAVGWSLDKVANNYFADWTADERALAGV